MFFVQALLREFGFESSIFVEHVEPRLAGAIYDIATAHVEKTDILLVHHSMGHNALDRVVALTCRKILIYHNITPPDFFGPNDPTRLYAIKGYAQLTVLRDIVEVAIGDSAFNARQLVRRGYSDVRVIPLLKDFTELRYLPHRKAPYYDRSAVFRILFVGRIAPHKCQHQLIELVDRCRTLCGYPVELVLAGSVASEDYKSRLDQMVARFGLEAQVRFTGLVSDAELYGWYRAANAYLSFSEHEGFGVPLIEAMAFDCPVVAYSGTGIAETLGDGGIGLPDKDPTTVADALTRIHEDRLFRASVINRQRSRLQDFSRERLAASLWRLLVDLGVAAGVSPVSADLVGLRPATERNDASRRDYVVEGPYETSYSLALVNRNLACALSRGHNTRAFIEPSEGTEDYTVNEAAADGLPAVVRELVWRPSVDSNCMVTIRNTYPPRPNGMLGDWRLLHLAWEESALPDGLAGLINLHVDGVLVPSAYVQRVVRNAGVRVPIAVIGHGVDHVGGCQTFPRTRQARGPVSPAMPFTFLHVSSGLARKGIEELITAYCLAFSRDDPVILVIKTFDNAENIVDHWIQRLTRGADYAPAIQVIYDDLDAQQMEFLYNAADAVVLPTRGEGFNLPAAEALSRGLPLIVTGHSGHLDFSNSTNAVLLDFVYELSRNHLTIRNSYWARPSIDGLVQGMKAVYASVRTELAEAMAASHLAVRNPIELRWSSVAKEIQRFVETLEHRPVMLRKPKLAWISTYNARCGIATHSSHLLEFINDATFEITIIADHQEKVGEDPSNIVRLWSSNGGDLTRVREFVARGAFDLVFIQYNFNFYDFRDFTDMLVELGVSNVPSFVTLHRTKDLERQDRLVSEARMMEAFNSCTRIFVHSLEDVNRLRGWGVTENVVLLTHGVIDRPPLNPAGLRGVLGLGRFEPIIGSFGFMLPGKGLPELIHSFALLLRTCPEAYLLMLNANYPNASSVAERERCEALARLLGVEHRIRLFDEFLDTDELLLMLNACHVAVYPYQDSDESASGAIRLGLAAGCPVAATPLPVFSDLSQVLYELPGTEPVDMAEGIISLLRDSRQRDDLVRRQRDWVRQNSWSAQAARISNIMLGCLEERRGCAVRVATRAMLGPASEIADDPKPNQAVSAGEAAAEDETLQPADATARSGDHAAARRMMARADRARDRREWSTAARYYAESLRMNGDNPGAWVQYGHALKEGGDPAAAETAYRKSLDIDSRSSDTHLQLGHALKLQGRNVEASVEYLRALMLDPGSEHAAAELKALGWRRGRIELALRSRQESADPQGPSATAGLRSR